MLMTQLKEKTPASASSTVVFPWQHITKYAIKQKHIKPNILNKDINKSKKQSCSLSWVYNSDIQHCPNRGALKMVC